MKHDPYVTLGGITAPASAHRLVARIVGPIFGVWLVAMAYMALKLLGFL
jgi:hypothetical protein